MRLRWPLDAVEDEASAPEAGEYVDVDASLRAVSPVATSPGIDRSTRDRGARRLSARDVCVLGDLPILRASATAADTS